MAVDARIRRLGPGDRELARSLFAMMAGVFGEPGRELGDDYLDDLLRGNSFWALAALIDGAPVGGLTAHVIPLTREEAVEAFVYDVAVVESHRREGVGRALIGELRRLCDDAGIRVAFVAADDDDTEALEFYRALGGDPSSVTMFTFGASA